MDAPAWSECVGDLLRERAELLLPDTGALPAFQVRSEQGRLRVSWPGHVVEGTAEGWMFLCAEAIGTLAHVRLGCAPAPMLELPLGLGKSSFEQRSPALWRVVRRLLEDDRERGLGLARALLQVGTRGHLDDSSKELFGELTARELEDVKRSTVCEESLDRHPRLSATRGATMLQVFLADPDPLERLSALHALDGLVRWYSDDHLLRIVGLVGESFDSCVEDPRPLVRQYALRLACLFGALLTRAGAYVEALPYLEVGLRNGFHPRTNLACAALCHLATGVVESGRATMNRLQALESLGAVEFPGAPPRPKRLSVADVEAAVLEEAARAQISFARGEDPCAQRKGRDRTRTRQQVILLPQATLASWMRRAVEIHRAALAGGMPPCPSAATHPVSLRLRHCVDVAGLFESMGLPDEAETCLMEAKDLKDQLQSPLDFDFDEAIRRLRPPGRNEQAIGPELTSLLGRWVRELLDAGAIEMSAGKSIGDVNALVDTLAEAVLGDAAPADPYGAVLDALLASELVEEVFESDEALRARLHRLAGSAP